MIPVLLMLGYPPGYPYASPGPIQAAQRRASDAERDTTVDILCCAVGDGRLTLAELDGRVEAALSARTRSELLALISDLPTRRVPSSAETVKPADGAGDRPRRGESLRSGNPAARPAVRTPSRWSLIQSLIDTWASPAPA